MHRSAILAGISMLALTGCMVGPKYVKPAAPTTPSFKEVDPNAYKGPGIAGTNESNASPGANCFNATPKTALPGDAFGDWSNVDYTDSASAYGPCTLTYDLAFQGYKEAGFKFAPYQTVRDFLNGYVVFGGQAALITSETNYAPLPETPGLSGNNVIAAAKFSAALISQ